MKLSTFASALSLLLIASVVVGQDETTAPSDLVDVAEGDVIDLFTETPTEMMEGEDMSATEVPTEAAGEVVPDEEAMATTAPQVDEVAATPETDAPTAPPTNAATTEAPVAAPEPATEAVVTEPPTTAPAPPAEPAEPEPETLPEPPAEETTAPSEEQQFITEIVTFMPEPSDSDSETQDGVTDAGNAIPETDPPQALDTSGFTCAAGGIETNTDQCNQYKAPVSVTCPCFYFCGGGALVACLEDGENKDFACSDGEVIKCYQEPSTAAPTPVSGAIASNKLTSALVVGMAMLFGVAV